MFANLTSSMERNTQSGFAALGGLLLFLEGVELMHEDAPGRYVCVHVSLYLIVDFDRVHAWDV
jgi:hypothetical protein